MKKDKQKLSYRWQTCATRL